MMNTRSLSKGSPAINLKGNGGLGQALGCGVHEGSGTDFSLVGRFYAKSDRTASNSSSRPKGLGSARTAPNCLAILR